MKKIAIFNGICPYDTICLEKAKDLPKQIYEEKNICIPSQNKNNKRRSNILYKLRRKGIKVILKEKEIECPYGQNITNISQVKHLCEEFDFHIQLILK